MVKDYESNHIDMPLILESTFFVIQTHGEERKSENEQSHSNISCQAVPFFEKCLPRRPELLTRSMTDTCALRILTNRSKSGGKGRRNEIRDTILSSKTN